MKDITTSLDRYVAVWNETDPAQRRRTIKILWRDDAVYANSASEYRGHDQIIEGITVSHDQWIGAGHSFRAAGPADVHHGVARLVWHMYGPAGGDDPVSVGTNFIVFDNDGKIVSDHQFLDR